MEWISLKVRPRSHFDGQGDVSHLPTRLAEAKAPVLSICPLRAHSTLIERRQVLICSPQPCWNPSPLACQSQSCSELRGGSPAVSRGRWWELSFHGFPRCVMLFCIPKGRVCSVRVRRGPEPLKHRGRVLSEPDVYHMGLLRCKPAQHKPLVINTLFIYDRIILLKSLAMHPG